MWLLFLEALAALLLLIGLVWWTMFSGRKGGERVAASKPVDEGVPVTAAPVSATDGPAPMASQAVPPAVLAPEPLEPQPINAGKRSPPA